MRSFQGKSLLSASRLRSSSLNGNCRCFTAKTITLLSKINVNDLAKGLSAPDHPQVKTLDQNWYKYAKTLWTNTDAKTNSEIDYQARERIVRAQREAAMRELPPAMYAKLQQQQSQMKASQSAGAPSTADLSKYSTVKDTLDAADPHRLSNATSAVDRLESSVATTAAANDASQFNGVGGLGARLDNGDSSDGSSTSADEKAPSLSIAPSYIPSNAIITPQQIRAMFRESVQARTVANTALRKYIKALNAKDYALAVAAYDGCVEGGLRVDSDTYCTLLDLLLAAQQLRAGMELYQTMVRDRNPPNTYAYNALMRLCMERGALDTALTLYDEMPAKGRAYDRVSHEIAMEAISKQPHPVNWQKAVQIFEKATAGAVDKDGVPFEEMSRAEEDSDAAGGGGGGGGSSRRSKRRNLLDETNEGPEYVPPADTRKQTGGIYGRTVTTNRATASTYNALMRVYLAMEPFEWRVVYNCYFEMRNSKPKVPITWESYRLVAEAMRRGEASRTRRVITYLDAWIQLTSIGSARFIMGFAFYALLIGILKMILGFFFTDKMKESQDAGVNVQSELPVGHETIAVGLAGQPTRAKI